MSEKTAKVALNFNNEKINVELTEAKKTEALKLTNYILLEVKKLNKKTNTSNKEIIENIIISSILTVEFKHNKELAEKYNFTTSKQIDDLINYLINDLATSGPSKKQKLKKYRISATFCNQTIKHELIEISKLAEVTKLSIYEAQKAQNIEVYENTKIKKGIDLTAVQSKLIHALQLFYLYNKHNKNKVDYSISRNTNKIVNVNLIVSKYELAKIYTSKENPSGTDLNHIYKLLYGLQNTYFIIDTLDLHTEKKELRATQLINLESLSYSTLYIRINPVFFIDIDKYYLSYPANFLELQNNSKIYPKQQPPYLHNLITYINKIRTINISRAKRLKQDCIKEVRKLDTLLLTFLPEVYKSNKSLAKKRMLKSFDFLIEIKLLKSYEIEKNNKNDDIINFIINKNWE